MNRLYSLGSCPRRGFRTQNIRPSDRIHDAMKTIILLMIGYFVFYHTSVGVYLSQGARISSFSLSS